MADKPKKSDIRAFHNRVLKASKATHSKRAVLLHMCWHSEWHTGGRMIWATKSQLAKDMGTCEETVKRAWRFLKDEGTLRIYQNELGGRGNAIRWGIQVAEKGEHNVAKGEHNVVKEEHNEPPIHESIYPEEKRSAASRSGGTIKREDGDAVNTPTRGRAENKGAGGYRPRNPKNLHPDEIAEIVKWDRQTVQDHCETLHDTNQNERANAVWAAWQEANPDE